MGMYDTLAGVPDKYDPQLKCWDCSMAEYELGSTVPAVGIAQAYSIQLGGDKGIAPLFVIIEDLTIKEVAAHDPATGTPVFDKWGRYIGHGGKHVARPGPSPMEQALNGPMMSLPWTVQKPAPEPVQKPVQKPVSGTITSPKQERKEPKVPIVTHQLRLRDRFGVHLKLPTDLTQAEADRIASWVKALPLVEPERF